MDKERKLYLTLLNKIFHKNIMRVFLEFKNVTKELTPHPNSKNLDPNLKIQNHHKSRDRILKVNSMTETFLSQYTEESSNLFEELKQSLQSKVIQGEFTPVKTTEKVTTPKFVHSKNTFSLGSSFFSKGTRKSLMKTTTDVSSEVAVVSSTSLVNLNKGKKMNIFGKK
jgi:hypothetical protein